MKRRPITFNIERITAAKAAQYLDLNVKNRRVSKMMVSMLAKAMEDGEWELTGQPIIFTDKGDLADGQHRLEAVVQSGVTIETVVIRGIPEVGRASLDRGSKRSIGQILQMNGAPNGALLAGAAAYMRQWDRGRSVNASRGRELTWGGTQDVLKAHPDLGESVRVATEELYSKMLSPSTMAFIHRVLCDIDETDGLDFLTALVTGSARSKTSPIFRLRKRLQDNMLSHKKMLSHVLVALTFKAWNLHRNGKLCHGLKFLPATEAFPIPDECRDLEPDGDEIEEAA